MKTTFLFILLFKLTTLSAQTSTNSAGSGNFNSTATWTSPQDLTGTANILTGHTINIPNIGTFYSNKITFTGSGNLTFANKSSKWVPSTSMNSSPPAESLNNQINWYANTVWAGDRFNIDNNHYTPWIDSRQAWSAASSNNGSDYLQYDLQSAKFVQGIVTQGRANMAQWVTNAKVEVSTDNINWSTAALNLALNTDQNTKVYKNFPNVMYARYIRVIPNINGVYGHASMRLGILLRENIFKSCKEIIDSYPNAASGNYTIDPDGTAGPQPVTSCYCDMTTDGGGWTLVLNYLHAGGTNPSLVIKTNSLPLLGSTTLGTDESTSTTTWGHTSNSYLNSFTFTELRFYGITSAHARILDFKTSLTTIISYVKSGTGSMSGIQTSNTSIGNTANLPGSASSFFPNEGDLAMTNFPFYLGGTFHWGIRGGSTVGTPSPVYFRWEVDDFPALTGNGYQNHTFHQIWIR